MTWLGARSKTSADVFVGLIVPRFATAAVFCVTTLGPAKTSAVNLFEPVPVRLSVIETVTVCEPVVA